MPRTSHLTDNATGGIVTSGMSNKEEVGRRVRSAREAAGINGAELARRTGLRPDQVSRYEHGHIMPGHAALSSIALATGVTVDWLLMGRGEGPGASAPTGTDGA